MATDNKYGQVQILGIPDDEPIFILRAQDKASTDTIFEYADWALDHGATEEFADAVNKRAEQFKNWQDENPDKVKVPD